MEAEKTPLATPKHPLPLLLLFLFSFRPGLVSLPVQVWQLLLQLPLCLPLLAPPLSLKGQCQLPLLHLLLLLPPLLPLMGHQSLACHISSPVTHLATHPHPQAAHRRHSCSRLVHSCSRPVHSCSRPVHSCSRPVHSYSHRLLLSQAMAAKQRLKAILTQLCRN